MRSVLSHLKVGIDLDGVLAHSDAGAVSWFIRHGLVPPETSAAQVTHYDYARCFDNVTHDTMKEMFRDPRYFYELEPDYDAAQFVSGLHSNGAEVHIVTHRDWRPEDQWNTALWLQKHEVPYDRLEFRTPEEKPLYAARWSLDYFVEDHPRTAYRMCVEQCGVKASFLRDKPYNRNSMEHSRLFRFYRWREMRDFFRL